MVVANELSLKGSAHVSAALSGQCLRLLIDGAK